MQENKKTNTDIQENKKTNTDIQEDIDAVVKLLDHYMVSGDSRIKLNVVNGMGEEKGELISRQYHHGRCDVGSPWACGTAFDVLE